MDKRELDRQISEYEDGKLTRTNARDLAALYIIRDYLYPENTPERTVYAPMTSYAGPDTIPEYGDTPFYRAIAGKDPEAAWRVMAQLVETLSAVSGPLYRQVMQQLDALRGSG